MAIAHFSVSIVSRGDGRSAVLSAAYRHCARMEFDREARTVDYTRKERVLHEEFLLPGDAPQWLRSLIADRSIAGSSEAFWNTVEAFEKRADAQLAKDLTMALPQELSAQQNIALVRDFVERHILSKGMVADWVYHDNPGNPHVHLMTTLRPLTEDGFGAKKVAVLGEEGQPLRTKGGKIVYELWAGGGDDFNAFRDAWFERLNHHLALNGIDLRVDGRSYEKQGIDLVPTVHVGVGAKAIERKAQVEGRKPELERLELKQERREENARRIQQNPTLVLDLITREKSVFDERDIARVLHRYIDDAGLFRNLMVRLLQDQQILRLERERISLATGVREPAKYTTRELIRLEAQMSSRATWLSRRSSHGVAKRILEQTFSRHEGLSQEQRSAIEHVAGGARIAAVVGRAGAGKTTMMKAAREAWETAGYRVLGAALAGKAAEGLEKEAGIASRTLSSWELRWKEQRDRLNEKTVFVLDEAGMVSSRQLTTFVEAVTSAGAKLVLVGDPDQLQPIEAGAAFRAITDRIGYAELETIFRQRDNWMRTASMDLARGDVGAALAAYDNAGMVRAAWSRDEAIGSLIDDWNSEYDPARTSLILAHRRSDVRTLNELAREKLVERGIVGEGFAFRTEDGARRFAVGDRVVFLKNEGSLGVKNGMLATVVEAAPGRIVAAIGEGDDRRQVVIEQRFYANVDHGYATTVHKSQGATVDDVKVLASGTMDRHLTYVALTRHRDAARLYVGLDEFTNRGGVLVEHGAAPFEHNPENKQSYFVTLEIAEGKQNTIWGVDLKRAMAEAAPRIGDRIGLDHQGSQEVRLPDGSKVKRHEWKVVDVRKLALSRMTERLSRDGSKETTLDYQRAPSYRAALRFAETRGLDLMNVARTILRDRLEWTIRQRQRLADLGSKLLAIGARLGLISGPRAESQSTSMKEARPMVAGVTIHPKSLEQAVEDKLAADPALKKQWDEVSTRFRRVFADPETAFRAVDVDAMLKDSATAKSTLATIGNKPEGFGPLKGKTGIFASRADKQDRETATVNAQALARDLARYLEMREAAAQRLESEERALRHRVSIDIPALSPAARSVLERVRDAIDRNDLPAALGYALADREAKQEIDGFNKAVAERFGERTLLSNAACEPSGRLFESLAKGLQLQESQHLKEAWPAMRAAQQLAAQERTVATLKQAEDTKLSQRQTSIMKQ
ncbi:Ti-type conjugative transfer relaxase TraA [Mesorhizobium sp. M2D.F.Ca.ET.185.01.1.1]|uniref:Ti-type conjugative transfer relaxase TraA n=2 Tax=Mesorhizobium TaxID=68287 RepID=UPI000FCBCCEA|nr:MULTISPECIES: Ti-type conjugative transfer relaxase TraA [unclassified Mesorhizobium]TGP77306.1 Ti-type conjugative transfer relaxase TraA [bacterium M00.F.Ca.ET.227.01.1.1]TGP93100.1 Ti-type conjugative transfer relaxase TraA [bacterium M00.F.Ca.ET.222.01.1.1]TGP96646.1 Ti-type conjugative transfer relaxase TraA [bacterium M00.F.Ca.ET.221.01.1.1]TGU20723.1 Ti-type conjugative transfer relaxase TraA [bacterium M00.F.Ca.ET.156.01.1.1]TGU49858.1 Ti-type conjugative transfer relaxase TraA [bac